MRLLLVVQEAVLPQRHLENALPRLVGRGHEVFLCVLGRPGPLLDHAAAQGVDGTALSSATPATLGRGATGTRQIIRDWRPDLVHAHEPLPAIAAGTGAARSGVPVVYHRHHLAGSKRLRFASWTATRVTRGTLAVSAAVAERARTEDHRAPERVVVAHNGVASFREVGDAEVGAMRAELGLGAGLVLVVVARLRREKGLHHLLAALPLLVGTLPEPVHLVVVGEGPQEAELREGVPSSRPGEVRFVGRRDDVAPWYTLGDVVVLPSMHEGLPLAAIEAMASARPIVASAVGGLPELVDDGVTGTLVPPGDPAALARALVELGASPELRVAMGRAARERHAARFNADAMVMAWERGYKTLRSNL